MIAALVSFFNPALVVIGGGVTGLGHTLLAAIRTQVYRQSLPLATGNLPIVLGELGAVAGVIGAARLISDHLFSYPPAPTDPPTPHRSTGDPPADRTGVPEPPYAFPVE